MDAIFANAPIARTVVEVQILRISFDAPCRYCQRQATTNIRPVDAIGSPMVADLTPAACTPTNSSRVRGSRESKFRCGR
jgi:hypothetical protein